MRFIATNNHRINLPFSESNKKVREVGIWRGFSDDDWEYLRYAESYGYSWSGDAYVDGYDITRGGGSKAFWEGQQLILINQERCPNVAVRITFE
jgi:hypothetical protein